MEDYSKMVVGYNKQGNPVHLKDVQNAQLKILKDVSEIFDNHSIDYFLAWGTMLGAIRHKGFIPWDDDIDICIFLDDYNKCLDVLNTYLDSNEYIVHSFETNYKYNVCINPIKVRLKNTHAPEPPHMAPNHCGNDGVFIDIFVFHNVSKNKVVDYGFRALSGISMALNFFAINMNIHIKWLKKSFINTYRLYHKLMKNSNYRGMNGYWFYSKPVCYPKELFYPLREVDFEGYKFKCINDYDTFLTVRYGDYMQLPDEKERRFRHISQEIDL